MLFSVNSGVKNMSLTHSGRFNLLELERVLEDEEKFQNGNSVWNRDIETLG